MAITFAQAHAHIGDGVIYVPRGSSAEAAEEGTITSVSGKWVFVRYGSSRQSAATDPADLTLLAADLTERRRSFRASLRDGGDG